MKEQHTKFTRMIKMQVQISVNRLTSSRSMNPVCLRSYNLKATAESWKSTSSVKLRRKRIIRSWNNMDVKQVIRVRRSDIWSFHGQVHLDGRHLKTEQIHQTRSLHYVSHQIHQISADNIVYNKTLYKYICFL